MSIIGNTDPESEDAVERMKSWLFQQADAHESVLGGIKLRPAGYIGKSPQSALVDVILPGASWKDEAPTIYIDAASEYGDEFEPVIKAEKYVGEKESKYVIYGSDEANGYNFRELITFITGKDLLPEPKLSTREICEALGAAPLVEAWDAGAAIRLNVGAKQFKLVELHE